MPRRGGGGRPRASIRHAGGHRATRLVGRAGGLRARLVPPAGGLGPAPLLPRVEGDGWQHRGPSGALPAGALGVGAPRHLWAVFIHSNVRIPLGPLRFVLGAPELHHWHHLRTERTAHNFANLAPWLDLLFGTYHRPEAPETFPLGIPEPWPRGYLAQLARPFGIARAADRRAPGA